MADFSFREDSHNLGS